MTRAMEDINEAGLEAKKLAIETGAPIANVFTIVCFRKLFERLDEIEKQLTK